jgi:hypothetical protein
MSVVLALIVEKMDVMPPVQMLQACFSNEPTYDANPAFSKPLGTPESDAVCVAPFRP